MERFWLLSFLLLAAPQVLARSVDQCPVLPIGSGLEWTYSEGIDFDICRAHTNGSTQTAFGIYLGNHPSFKPELATPIGDGEVAARRVTWYRRDAATSASDLSRQTLLMLDRKSDYVAHIWLIADTEQQLADRLSILKRIVFKFP